MDNLTKESLDGKNRTDMRTCEDLDEQDHSKIREICRELPNTFQPIAYKDKKGVCMTCCPSGYKCPDDIGNIDKTSDNA